MHEQSVTQQSAVTSERKVVIIGLDGVPYSLLKNYADQKIMPHFHEMISRGNLLSMDSTLPEVSSVAWTSFMTGENPAEHGVFGFMDIDRNSYDYIFPNFLTLKSRTFWEVADFPTIALNIPQTYPAKPLHGILVSGFVAIDLQKAVYPKRIYEYLKGIEYRLDVKSELALKDPELFFQDLFFTFEKRTEALKHLYENEEYFQNEVNKCLEITDNLLPFKLKDILYPENGEESDYKITDTIVTQPVLFIFEYSLEL